MGFRSVILGVLGLMIGLAIVLSTVGPQADGKDITAIDEEAGPSLGDFASAIGVFFNSDGQMNGIGGPSDVRLVTDPQKTRRREFYGWKVEHPGLTGPGDSIHLVQDALSGVPRRLKAEHPARVLASPAEANCQVPALAAGQKMAKAQVFDGITPSGYHVVTDRELASGASGYVADLQRTSDPMKERASGDTKPTPVVNVVLTDTSAPLYLVLQGATQALLWNLHAADGVEVARIVLVGNPGQAVHPLSEDTPVHFLEMQSGCAPQPWRAVASHWDLFHRAGVSSTSEDFEGRARDMHGRYEAWFSATFGTASEPDTVGAFTASHVLVGPMPATPEARATYRSLEGALIRAQEGPRLFVGSAEERRAAVASARRDLVLEAVGGELARINPEPMERIQ
ncbi:MAG: hypothetical protein AAF871_03250 [Pseudomonadota bacterium]